MPWLAGPIKLLVNAPLELVNWVPFSPVWVRYYR